MDRAAAEALQAMPPPEYAPVPLQQKDLQLVFRHDCMYVVGGGGWGVPDPPMCIICMSRWGPIVQWVGRCCSRTGAAEGYAARPLLHTIRTGVGPHRHAPTAHHVRRAPGCLDPQCVLCQHQPQRRCMVNFDRKWVPQS